MSTRWLVCAVVAVGVLGLEWGLVQASELKPLRLLRPELDPQLRKLGYYPIRMERDKENHLLLRADVNREARTLLLNTGGLVTGVDRSLAKRLKTLHELGVTVEDRGLGRVTNADMVLIERIDIQSASFLNSPATVTDLKALASADTPGITLGCDFLARNFCLVDCLDLTLYVRSARLAGTARAALGQTLREAGFRSLAVSKRESGLAGIEAAVNGREVRLALNTGAMFTLLDLTRAKELGLRPYQTDARARGSWGSRAFLLADVKSFEIAGIAQREKRVGIVDKRGLWPDEVYREFHGELGNDLLALNGALIDLDGAQVWLNPPKPAQ